MSRLMEYFSCGGPTGWEWGKRKGEAEESRDGKSAAVLNVLVRWSRSWFPHTLPPRSLPTNATDSSFPKIFEFGATPIAVPAAIWNTPQLVFSAIRTGLSTNPTYCSSFDRSGKLTFHSDIGAPSRFSRITLLGIGAHIPICYAHNLSANVAACTAKIWKPKTTVIMKLNAGSSRSVKKEV